jgi:DNA-binding CsgD family transcriptional regulator
MFNRSLAAFFQQLFHTYGLKTFGFAAYIGWCYHTFFLSALGISWDILWCDEWVWVVLELTLGIAAFVAGVLSFTLPRFINAVAGSVCFAAAVIGSVLIGVGHIGGAELSSITFLGEALCGVALALLGLRWGRWMSAREEDESELLLLASFGLGAILCIALLLLDAPVRTLGSACLAAVAVWLAFFRKEGHPEQSTRVQTFKEIFVSVTPKSTIIACLLYFFIWALVAYFRIMAAPRLTEGNELMLPFGVAFAVVWVGLVLCLTYSRYVNFSLIYRWTIPLLILSCGFLYSFHTETGNQIAYLANFVALFGSQVIFWIAVSKFVHQSKANPIAVFTGFLMSQGIGVTAGTFLGLAISANYSFYQTGGFSFLLLGIFILVVMVWGFTPALLMRCDYDDTPPTSTNLSPFVFMSVPFKKGDAQSYVRAAPRNPYFSAEKGEKAYACTPISFAVKQVNECAQNEARGGVVASATSFEVCSAPAPTSGNSEVSQVRSLVSESREMSSAVEAASESPYRLFEKEAHYLRETYGLTKRETEIASLLLEGRNRPYIRDELVISLHTVHAHVRNIMAKCGVHSQQELINLARPRH